jgi:indole-3-glycerol phosphate synthase
MLPGDRLARLIDAARALDLEPLVEVFVDEDPSPSIAVGADIIGVNARDLASFTTRLDLVEAMADRLPDTVVRVAESGITGRDDIVRLAESGYDGFLVGEHLVRAEDPELALRRLLDVDVKS